MAIVGACMVPHPPIILPEVGEGEEQRIRETTDAYEKAAAMVRELAPETVVISSPHSVLYADYFHISPGRFADGNMARFRAPQVQFHAAYDTRFAEQLAFYADEADFPAGTLGERDPSLDHGTMIPLYFINRVYTRYRLVRIGLSGLPLEAHYRMGQMVQRAAQELDRRVFFIGSGDLSHKLLKEGPYGFDADGPRYDERIMDVMGRAAFGELFDFEEAFCEKAAECGHRSFVMMAGALDQREVQTERLSHQGTFGVGYGVCTYRVTGTDPGRDFLAQREKKSRDLLDARRAAEDAYVRLARSSFETYVRTGKRLEAPAGLPPEMTARRAGAFVSLHLDGRLRGCIGTIQATQENLAEEIIENAISASTRDPRFSPVTADELDRLECSVDILGETERIDSPEALDVKRYGVIVTKGGRRGLLLPNLDGVDTVEQQISIAKQKAGIRPEESGVQLERFEVVRHY